MRNGATKYRSTQLISSAQRLPLPRTALKLQGASRLLQASNIKRPFSSVYPLYSHSGFSPVTRRRSEFPHYLAVSFALITLTFRMVAIHPYYLGANPTVPPHSTRHQSMSQANLPSHASNSSLPSQQQKRAANRQSMPPQRVASSTPPSSPPAFPP